MERGENPTTPPSASALGRMAAALTLSALRRRWCKDPPTANGDSSIASPRFVLLALGLAFPGGEPRVVVSKVF